MDLSQRHNSGAQPPDPGRRHDHLVIVMSNAAVAGLGNLYVATKSVSVVVIGAVLTAVLVVIALLNRRR